MVMVAAPEIAIRSRSLSARKRYIETAEQAARAGAQNEPRSVVESCVAWLELFFIGTLIWEYIQDHDIRSFDELNAHNAELNQHLNLAFPGRQANESSLRSLMRDLKLADDTANDWPEVDWSQSIRSIDAIIAETPIDTLEKIARTIDDPALAHRARSVYDALRAFVRRHDPAHAEIMRIVGEQYRRGGLRMHDAAVLLGVSTADAVFELEQDGFARPLSAIELSEAERTAIYERLRRQRRQRATPPVVSQDLVERDVIASERIEGVDARVWIHR